MRFGATVLYVNDVPAAIDFYRRAFGLPLRFYDERLGFAELETGGSILAIASHSIGELLMPGAYSPPEGGRPAGVCDAAGLCGRADRERDSDSGAASSEGGH